HAAAFRHRGKDALRLLARLGHKVHGEALRHASPVPSASVSGRLVDINVIWPDRRSQMAVTGSWASPALMYLKRIRNSLNECSIALSPREAIGGWNAQAVPHHPGGIVPGIRRVGRAGSGGQPL